VQLLLFTYLLSLSYSGDRSDALYIGIEKYRGNNVDGVIYRRLVEYRDIPSGGIDD